MGVYFKAVFQLIGAGLKKNATLQYHTVLSLDQNKHRSYTCVSH